MPAKPRKQDIDVPNETFRLVSTTTVSAAELGNSIAPDAPRYSFYRHDAAPDGSRPILFIYTCPPTSKVKERMVYAASRGFALHLAEKEASIEIHKRVSSMFCLPARWYLGKGSQLIGCPNV